MTRLLPLAILASCTVPELQVIDELAVEEWRPDEDGFVAKSTTESCLPSDRPDALEPLWCMRISPEAEPDDEFEGGEGEGHGTPQDMRCRFYNLIGSAGLTGTAALPVLTYCDNDTEGGVRVGSYDAEDASQFNEIIQPRECRGIPQDGGHGTLGGDSGLFSSFIRWDVDDTNRVYLTEQSPDGTIKQLPMLVPGTEEPARTTVSGSSVFIGFADGMLQARALDDIEIPHFIATDAVRFGLGLQGDRDVVAICSEAAEIRAVFLDDLNVSRTVYFDSPCQYKGNPVVAGSDEAVAIAWGLGSWTQLVFLDNDLSEQARHAMDAPLVELTWDGDHFWSLDSDGALQKWTEDGELLGTYAHPFIPHKAGNTIGLRLFVEDGILIVASITEIRIVSGIHQSLTNTLDLSAVPLPTEP